MIELKNLTKKFGDFTAVDDLSLTVQPGEIFGFLGPNGAGKTTTIRMMTGVIAPTEGSISVNGIDLAKEPERAKSIMGYIPDDPYVYEKLTGYEFLLFVGNLFRVPLSVQTQRLDDLIRMFRMEDIIGRRIDEYSRGNRQRITIMASLVHDPSIFVFDEPVVGLDPATIRLVEELLVAKAREGKTVFLSTHTLDVAERICTKLGIIHHGKLLTVGTKEELKKKSGLTNPTLEDVFFQATGDPSTTRRLEKRDSLGAGFHT